MTALRLAVSWLTVFPLAGPAEVDRKTAGRAIAFVPLIGLLLGIFVSFVGSAFAAAQVPSLAIGFVIVALTAMLTRGMHLDGLADTFDGLGCYGPPERAREVMKSGSVGPFGAVALIICLGLQAVSFGALAQREWWLFIALAIFGSRVLAVVLCRKGVDAAPGSSFGALVAGTQPWYSWIAWIVAYGAAAFVLTVYGVALVLPCLIIAILFAQHCIRRFGGLSGDVLGATIEINLTLSAVALTMLHYG